MNATHKIKLVSLTTALGVFLVGCGGGPNNEVSRTVTGASTTTPLPSVSPVTSGGTGGIGYSGNDTLDQIATNSEANTKTLAAMNNTLNETLNQSKKSSQWAKIAGIAGIGLATFGIFRAVGGMKTYNQAYKAKNGKDAGFWNRLWQGGVLGNKGESLRAEVNSGEHKATQNQVGEVGANVDTVGQDVGKFYREQRVVNTHVSAAAIGANAKAGEAVVAARAAGQSADAAARSSAAAQTAVEIAHEDLGSKMDAGFSLLQESLGSLTANVVKFNEDMKTASKESLDARKAEFDSLSGQLKLASAVVVKQAQLLEKSDEVKAASQALVEKLDALKQADFKTNAKASAEALEAATKAMNTAAEKISAELAKVQIVKAPAGTEVPASPVKSTSTPAEGEKKNLAEPKP